VPRTHACGHAARGRHQCRVTAARGVQFRLRAFQIAGASVSLQMQYPFAQGMGYHELVDVFKTVELLPEFEEGDTIELEQPMLLMGGSVTAFVADRKLTNLKRLGSTRALLQRTSVLPPQSPEGARARITQDAAQEVPVAAIAPAPPGAPTPADAGPTGHIVAAGRGGKDVEIAAPALLEPGSYPVVRRASVRPQAHALRLLYLFLPHSAAVALTRS
jgi:hypothetical protein